MTVIQAVDQVHITGTTTTGTHGQRSAQMCFRAGRKRPNFLVPHWDPNDVLTSANGVGNAIQGVSCDPKDALYPRCYQRLDQQFSYSFFGHFDLLSTFFEIGA
jgi:hypothetical protein